MRQTRHFSSDYEPYIYPETGSRMSTVSDATAHLSPVSLTDKRIRAAGPPVLIHQDRCYTDTDTSHWIIYGYTRSMKTRSVIRPFLHLLFRARESAIILDVKAELSSDASLRREMKENGIKPVFLDFRTCGSDGYNLLEYALRLYKSGDKDKAMLHIVNIVTGLMSVYHKSDARSDPFWELMSKAHATGLLAWLLELAVHNPQLEECCNLASLASWANEDGTTAICKIIDAFCSDSDLQSVLLLKSVISAPDRTRASIIATTFSILSDLMLQEDLSQMLSESTFDINTLYEEPTAVFLIVPDETTAFSNLAGILVDCFCAQLEARYTEVYQNRKQPPCRINYVIDEFCNARIPEMRTKISCSAGRQMRWLLVCQSLNQLKDTYPDDWATIIGNCRHTLFLQGNDPDMLTYISELAGRTWITENKEPAMLLPPEVLRTLKKEKTCKEALYIRDDFVLYTQLPDISQYECYAMYRNRRAAPIPTREQSGLRIYTPRMLRKDLDTGQIDISFLLPGHIEESEENDDIDFGDEDPDVILARLFGLDAEDDESE